MTSDALILVHQIESWVLIRICHVCRGYGLGACIYTPSFFTSFFIRNHNIHSFLGTFPSQKDFSLFFLHSSENVHWWERSVVGVVPNVWCPTIGRTTAPRVVSRSITFSKLSKRALGGMGTFVGVHKRAFSTDPSLSTISCVVGILDVRGRWGYSISSLEHPHDKREPVDHYHCQLSLWLWLCCLLVSAHFMVAGNLMPSHTASSFGQLLSSSWALQGLSCSAVGLTNISIRGDEIIDEDSSCIVS